MQVATRAKELGITHIISSDLGRTRRTAEIIAQACGCDIIFDSRLRELNMGVLEKKTYRFSDRRRRELASAAGQWHR
ncbi:phosphoglycerate mutase [Escherichia coli]|uniref:Phosphoglycerate mutase n=1 Tax=Escherichia coli TaxID=562 RepID=A0A376U209_ECOLX|nr:phosphoglycerate mutase [Escherichia coli]